MQVLYARCCGLDVHMKTVVACVMITLANGKVDKSIRTFATTTAALMALAEWLASLQVSHVAMESTGIFWRPIYTVLEDQFELLLANAHEIKAFPGRKTDVRDCEWIADLLRHGLIRPSFIPAKPVRVLRDLMRYRNSLVYQHSQDINRLHKVLETANIKLTSVVSDVWGKSGQSMLRAIIQGESDAQTLTELARGTDAAANCRNCKQPWQGASNHITGWCCSRSSPICSSWSPRCTSSSQRSQRRWNRIKRWWRS
jgi:transposase